MNKYFNKNIEFIKQMNTIVFIEETVEKTEFFKSIDNYGIVCNFERLAVTALIKRLKAIVMAYGVKVEDSTLRYFIEICGTNMQDLINEIRKLIEYTGKDGTITKESIDKLSTKQIDAVIFDLTDNLGSRKMKEALEVLNGLIISKEPIQKILITLYNHFKKLYIIKIATKENGNIADVLNLKPNQMFLVSKYKKQSSLFEEEELRQLLKEIANLDTNYKKGKIDLNIGLEAILCNYCGKS